MEKARAGPTRLHLGIPQSIPINLLLHRAEGTELGKVWILPDFHCPWPQFPFSRMGTTSQGIPWAGSVSRGSSHPQEPPNPGRGRGGQRPRGHREPHLAGTQMCILGILEGFRVFLGEEGPGSGPDKPQRCRGMLSSSQGFPASFAWCHHGNDEPGLPHLPGTPSSRGFPLPRDPQTSQGFPTFPGIPHFPGAAPPPV